MAKREQFGGKIECVCGAKGHATYEGNENPIHAATMQLQTVLIGVSEGFTIINGKTYCDGCGAHVHTDA